MIGVPDFIDENGCMTRASVSTSSSIHSNSWNWNAHSSSFCHRVAIELQLSSIEYIRMFGCFDVFECYDCNAVYSL